MDKMKSELPRNPLQSEYPEIKLRLYPKSTIRTRNSLRERLPQKDTEGQ